MSISPQAGKHKRTVTFGIVLAAVAAFSLALNGFVANALVDDGTPGVVVAFYEALFGLTLVVALNVKTLRRGPRAKRSSGIWIAAAGFAFAIAFGTFYTALGEIDYSVAAPILGAVPLVSYIAIPFVLRGHERITPRAILGATLVVAGVAAIGVAS